MTRPHLPIQILEHRDFTPEEARAITDRIRSKMGDLMSDIAKAWIGRAHAVLGYESWPDYVKGEFGHAPLHLPRDERAAVVALLRGQGMSTRAIAPVIGVDNSTVHDDLSRVGNPTPDEAVPVTGLDGKSYSVTCTPPQTPATAQPAPPQETITCPTCGGTGKVTQ